MMVILIAVLMILSALVIALPGTQGREYGMNPAASSSNNIQQPNPTMNVNVTWSNFESGWQTLEYNNGTANRTLNAGLSTIYQNPISINPADIQTAALHKEIGGIYYNDTTLFGAYQGGQTGSVLKSGDSGQAVYLTGNGTAVGGYYAGVEIKYPVTDLPSNNPLYDYITLFGTYSGPTTTGMEMEVLFTNNTTSNYPSGYNSTLHLYPNGHKQGYYMSMSLSQAGEKIANGLGIVLEINLPTATTTPENVTLNGLAITTFPMALGTNSTGQQVYKSIGNAYLSQFNPTAPMNITEGGYTVAVSQPLQNLTTSQAPISSGSYAEQVEYQGEFLLPTAPDLSYGAANVSEHFDINTSQTQVIDINGVSSLSSISGKNGTITLLSTVNPNQPTQFLQIVDYTQSQWTSISSPPGIFTLAGIEYYWEEFIIAILAVVGVGAGAASRHASNLRKVK